MDIKWDPAKARSNLKKHGVSFSDVEAAFYDPYAISFEDPDSKDEMRFIVIGADSLGRVVVAVYTYRDKVIRLISARKASKSERKGYEKGIRFQ